MSMDALLVTNRNREDVTVDNGSVDLCSLAVLGQIFAGLLYSAVESCTPHRPCEAQLGIECPSRVRLVLLARVSLARKAIKKCAACGGIGGLCGILF